MFRKIIKSAFSSLIIDKLFYHIDNNKKIKDFYCINDKAVTPSICPKLEKDRRNKTWLCCKCEKCGNIKKLHIATTWDIYKYDSEDDSEDVEDDSEDVEDVREDNNVDVEDDSKDVEDDSKDVEDVNIIKRI